jgi:hypothetical protein
MKPILIVLIVCVGVVAQSRDDVKKKYGDPISETFLLRPDITATVSYNSTGQVKELIIAPFTTGLFKSKGNGIAHETIKELIDELVPESTRGKLQMATMLNLTCLPANDCAGSDESYEKLTIYYNAGKNGNVNYAVVQWK